MCLQCSHHHYHYHISCCFTTAANRARWQDIREQELKQQQEQDDAITAEGEGAEGSEGVSPPGSSSSRRRSPFTSSASSELEKLNRRQTIVKDMKRNIRRTSLTPPAVSLLVLHSQSHGGSGGGVGSISPPHMHAQGKRVPGRQPRCSCLVVVEDSSRVNCWFPVAGRQSSKTIQSVFQVDK